jgi:hypothetical protein
MIKKILILFLISYFLVLFQTSFLIHCPIFGKIPSLILILTIFYNLFEKREKVFGLSFALFGGFFWDVFSPRPIIFHTSILLILAIFIKFVLKKYIQPVVKLNGKIS